ncbi:MAG TPA: hypothetical protein IAC09_07400, partial [Candidatus Cryptobacteroides intestinipullorum]|nr:hypothetical protein [Candidatus Cryptobacteroides intestinipullorum]
MLGKVFTAGCAAVVFFLVSVSAYAVPADFKSAGTGTESAGTEMEMDRFIDSLMAEMTVEE